MKTSSAKNKGRLLQQWVVKQLLDNGKCMEPDDCRSTSMGAGGEDVLLSPYGRKVWPFSFECKSYAKIAVYKWLEQAIANTPEGAEPIVVAKGNRKRPVVILDAEFFFKHWGGPNG